MKYMIKYYDETRDLTCGEISSFPMSSEDYMRKCGTQRSQSWRPLYFYERLIVLLGFRWKGLELVK